MLLLFYGKGPLGPTQCRGQSTPRFIYDYFKDLNDALCHARFLEESGVGEVKVYDLDKDLVFIKSLDPEAEEFRLLGFKYVVVVSMSILL